MADESQTRFAKKRYELRQALSERMDDCIMVTPDSGDATSLVDANLADEDDYYNQHSLVFYAGDNVAKIRTITDWELGTNTLTFATVTVAVDTADLAEIHIKFTATRYNQVINDAIDVAADFFLVPALDDTLAVYAWKEGETRAIKREYPIPAGFDYIDQVWLETSVTHQLVDCDTLCDEHSNVTRALDTDDYQEGSASGKHTISASISNGDVICSFDLDAAEDLSMYQKISFWMKIKTALAAADFCLLLDNNSGCGTPIETISLPAIPANIWTLVRCTLATPELCTAILSIGFEYNANKAANVFWLDDMRAQLEGQPFFGSLVPHGDWSIVHDTTPRLKFHNVTLAPGRAIRLVGQTHQATLSLETDTCAVPPEFIIQQAMAFLHQSKEEGEGVAVAQTLADAQKRKIRVVARKYAKAVKES